MTFMTFVNCDLFNAYACRSSDRCFYELNFFSNTAFIWAIAFSFFGQLLVVYFPPLQEIFQTEALYFTDLLYVMILSSTVLMLDTIRKIYFRSSCIDSMNNDTSTTDKKNDHEEHDEGNNCKNM